ncbi:hypothetical protein FB451DRAFT_1056188 [Mycena latifolia]|nr:hypothetical protein FB451DRAFT_1056188 [Mycena latifolia]
MPQYKKGQTVRYKPVGELTTFFSLQANTSETVGTIQDVLTEPGVQSDPNVNASEANPRYEIQNSNTSKMTTIYEQNILGLEE